MAKPIGTLVLMDGEKLKELLKFGDFKEKEVALKTGLSSMLILGEEAGLSVELPVKFDKLDKFGARFYDPREVGFTFPDVDELLPKTSWEPDDSDDASDDSDDSDDDDDTYDDEADYYFRDSWADF